MYKNSNYNLNPSLNDDHSSSTITLEEELDETHEPSAHEVRQYALQIGMKLPEDSQYLDIARAGLKAKLPQEWKVCQKRIQGEDRVFYKNTKTMEVIEEHPNDLIFRKKYEDARRLDLQSKSKKPSGVNKLKQNIQQARQDEPPKGGSKASYFEGPDDQSFMVESNTFHNGNNPYGNQNYVLQNPSGLLSNSAQHMFQSVDNEFQTNLQQYEQHRKEELAEYKEGLKQTLAKEELTMMNEADPELFRLKEQYLKDIEELDRQLDEKRKKIRKKVDENFEQEVAKQRNMIQKQSDRRLEDLQYEQDKEIKQQLRSYEQENDQSQKELVKRIKQRQKELSDMDDKLLKQQREKRKHVELQFEKVKKQLASEFQERYKQVEAEFQKNLKNDKEVVKRKINSKGEDQIRSQRSLILDYQTEYDRIARQTKEHLRAQYEPKFEQMQEEFNEEVGTYELQESQILTQSMTDFKGSLKKLDPQTSIQKRKNDLSLLFQNDLIEYDRKVQANYQEKRKKQEELQRQNLQRIQKDLEKKTGISLSGGREIDMFMEINQINTEKTELIDQVKKLRRKHEDVQQQLRNVQAVYDKFNLQKDLQEKEIVKYQVAIIKDRIQCLKVEKGQLEEEIERNVKLLISQTKMQAEQLQGQAQWNTMKNSVNEIREMSNESKMMQSGMSQKQMKQPDILINENLATSEAFDQQNVQIRKWKSILVDERVKLNRERDLLKSEREKAKQLQRKLAQDQQIVKTEIQVAKQLNQSQMKKDILKRMKQELQKQQGELSQKIMSLNHKRDVLKRKQAALEQMEKNCNENQPLSSQSMEQLHQLYGTIGETKQTDDGNLEQIEKYSELTDSYFHQLQEIGEQESKEPEQRQLGIAMKENPKSQEPEQRQLGLAVKGNPKRVLGYLYEEPQRLDLVEKKDWLQNYKYRIPLRASAAERFQRYQRFLQLT